MSEWWIYTGTGEPHGGIERLPDPPNWRTFKGEILDRPQRAETTDDEDILRHIGYRTARAGVQDTSQNNSLSREIELVNAALFLRRPLLVTGKPGSGKSSLAYIVAHELQLGPVLRWPITTRSTLAQGLYSYDAIGRLQDTPSKGSLTNGASEEESAPDIGKYLHLGPLGTALLPTRYPRVLLIDEIDKSDIDLPNDLLNIFEEGEFKIPELVRMSKKQPEVYVMPDDGKTENDRVRIKNGYVRCHAFPFIVLTSNGERTFPPAFLRRCLRLEIQPPNREKLAEIVEAHLSKDVLEEKATQQLIDHFLKLSGKGDLAADQLLNAIYMISNGVTSQDREKLFDSLLRYLSSPTSSPSVS